MYNFSYMNNFKLFTHDEEKFPLIQWQAVIREAREKNHQHLITIIDPGVKIEEGYTAYDDALKRDIFIKYRDEEGKIHNSIGVVWPGKVHFLGKLYFPNISEGQYGIRIVKSLT